MLSREQILSHVWGYDFDPGSNVVDVYVGYLRKKLGSGSITSRAPHGLPSGEDEPVAAPGRQRVPLRYSLLQLEAPARVVARHPELVGMAA